MPPMRKKSWPCASAFVSNTTCSPSSGTPASTVGGSQSSAPRIGTRHCTAYCSPLLGAGEVPVAIHARRHGHVGFLHMRLEFLEQRFAQRCERCHALFAVAVLRRHIVAHILRFLVAQPFVVIDERIAVEGALLWHPLRFRHRQSILVFVVRVRRFLHVHGVFHTPKFTHARDYTDDPPKLVSAVSRRFARRAGTAAWFS